MSKVAPSDTMVALLFFTAVFILRLPVLHRSVLDWDESLYFLMAQQWRAGHLPYTNIWDNKPVGIYAIFAVFQALLGGGIAAMRSAAAVFIALLAFTLFKITEALEASRSAGLVAGAALLLCSLSNDGLAANTELFMASFTALAVWAALRGPSGWLVGLALGAAFMVKYVAVFEAPFIALLFLGRHRRASSFLTTVLGAAIPLGAVILLYALAGKFPLWWDCAVASNFRRVSVAVPQGALAYAFTLQLWRWGPLYGLAIAFCTLAVGRRRGKDLFLAGWLLGGLAGVAAAKSFYDHYFLQILPVLCVMLGVFWGRLGPNRLLRASCLIGVLALPAWAGKIALGNALGPDLPARIAADLAAQHPASLYVFDSQPIIYALAGLRPPTRYVLPSELTGNFLPRIAGVDAPAELARILATGPAFIIRRNPAPNDAQRINPVIYARLDRTLAAQYRLWRGYPGAAVYQRK